MLALQFTPILFAALLLAAHFLRNGHPTAVALSMAIPVVLAVRRPWAAAILKLGLIVGAFEWVRTAFVLILTRRELGEPFLRLAAILGGVALATALSLLVFRSHRVKKHFRIGPVDPRSGSD